MIPKEMQDKIKADAENYAGVMVWINKHPKGEEQLFYEYISATSHEAGATEWAGKAKPVIDALCSLLDWHTKSNASGLGRRMDEAKAALAKYKEVGNG
jgi:hypothetical protein